MAPWRCICRHLLLWKNKKKVDEAVTAFESAYPEAYKAIADILKKYRKVGYKNVIKLLLNEATPEKLKGV